MYYTIFRPKKQFVLIYNSNLTMYRVSPAEKCPVEDGSVQLINAAVAAHWFDLPAYFKEVDRILSPNGIVAISSYGAEVEFSHPTAAEGLLAALRQVIHLIPEFLSLSFTATYRRNSSISTPKTMTFLYSP